MKYYFQIQLKRIFRWFQHLGIHPVIGILLSVAFFIGLSFLIFYKLAFAEWIYVLIGLYVLFELGNLNRTKLIKGMFLNNQFSLIRLIENAIAVVPFVIFLVYKSKFYFALGLIIGAVILSQIEMKGIFHRVVPTPFRKIPFENIVGFRKNYWFILLCYALVIPAIAVDNFNLGLFAFALVFFTCMSFYAQPEKIKFVWIFDCSVNSFLFKKILQGILAASILGLPLLVILSIAFSQKILMVLLIQMIGSLLVALMVLVKYSAYPYQINLPQGIFLALSVWFPPILIVAIPIFYIHSKKRLSQFLYD